VTKEPAVPDLLEAARTLLFVPGDRRERFAKAAAAGADLVVIDLEDAVSPSAKDAARAHAQTHLRGTGTAAVRVNAVGTPWHDADLAALAGTDAMVMLPKAEPGDALTSVADGGFPLLALVETAAGVLGAGAIAATPGVRRLAFGSFDLAAELGVDPLDRGSMLAARSALVLGSAAAGLPGPVDGVWASVVNDDGLREEAVAARRLGFTGKLCIHPRQVRGVRSAFVPSADELRWARQVIAAVDAGDDTSGTGVRMVDGAMVDRPVIDRARRMIEQEEAG
jgi:citrate lyase subunit beta/citryl-CoA lyase